MKISVVIPCHNVEAYIGPCLESVARQHYEDLEVIVVDDGSTDHTLAAIERTSTEHGLDLHLVVQENQGASAARNRGMQEASGLYLQFLDADDRLDPEKLAGQVALAGSSGLPDLIVGDIENQLADGSIQQVNACYGEPWLGLIATKLGTTSANLWKRDLVLELGGWNEDLASSQDYELMFRLLCSNGSVAFDRRALTRVIKRTSGSISRTDIKENWLRYIDLRKRIRDHLTNADPMGHTKELDVLDQYLFMAIHLLAQEDPSLAVELYKNELPLDFIPKAGPAITRRYVAAHRLLGFERAIRLGKMFLTRTPMWS